ncbi:MAG: Rnase Y domain-containing protein, partial [Muribaculaceae bacterium]|nr:Rnase Y domain-containing protein [Muribaculaceae bacterium]
MLYYIICSVIALAVGVVATFMVQKSLAKSRAKIIIEDAEREADVLMKNKLLEAREQEMKIKADAERAANQRMSKIQSQEAKIRQRETQLNQQQSENQRTRNELEGVRSNLESQIAANEVRREELEKLIGNARTQLEYISGLSSEEAKEKLVESLKDEAKTAAASYINDIMDEAKMTANKEAKKIVVQSIQRVATETAIENSVTIFHIDSDEIKGRIIGREGRNIRDLEAATGIEIIVDDTPEAIV